MKKYVILTPEIGNMGGAQMYVENKVIYLCKNGWEVQVFYYIYGENLKLPRLRQYKDNYIHDFVYAYYYVPSFKRKSILKAIADKVGKADEIVVESQLLTLSFWGELIAENLGGRHIINYLEEHVPYISEKEYSFLSFKLKRWEFMNAGPNSLKRLFKERLTEDLLRYQHPMSFQCTNVVDKNIVYDGDFAACDYTILSIGRLDKKYIIPMVKEIKRFAQQHEEKRMNVILIGGSLDGSIEKDIVERLGGKSNLQCYVLGYMFPVPSNILEMADVAIESANSVLVTAEYGIPTICVDMNDSFAIGVYNYTTINNFARREEPKTDISFWLKEILVECKYPRSHAMKSTHDNMIKEFDYQMKFVERSIDNTGYYNLFSIKSSKTLFVAHLKWFIHEYLCI